VENDLILPLQDTEKAAHRHVVKYDLQHINERMPVSDLPCVMWDTLYLSIFNEKAPHQLRKRAF